MARAGGHTLTAFDHDLGELRSLIIDMGSVAEAAIAEAMRCLIERDEVAAAELIAADEQLDDLEAEAERRAVELIALRAPMADDLREVVAALKIAGVVERVGDYAKNIARRVRRLPEGAQLEPMSLLPEMAKIAASMVHDAIAAFVERNPDAARQVCARDDALDDFYESIFRTLVTFMMEDPQNISPSTTLLFVAKNLERIGDHATNISEMVYYAATGDRLLDGNINTRDG
ncbi:phosphate signaling complex protein PhoU [Sphingomonas sp.]|uniref:phosphate signaling complex protein PhoU n=1 Tax=Sphingomonas sp. TaxID=28214 RepID=UPI0025F0A5B3|nr:phosphate signaling complex protein PhoU [Sphingomonas sp.]MBV9527505.1 phosphate signaling complex protein PhoU [Sphingomonas sp.]